MSPAPDRFFSQDDGLAETRHVFLGGTDLPAAWAGRARLVVAELGFGTGLNLLATAELAARHGSPPYLVYQSVELEPQPPAVLAGHGQTWPELAPAAAALLAVYQPGPGWNVWSWPWGEVRLWVGDARNLPAAAGALTPAWEPADAWFLDGWAPALAPELWEPDLVRWVAGQTVPGGRAATYSAAGRVKQALRAAGFTVVRAPGWGRKRHMVRAWL